MHIHTVLAILLVLFNKFQFLAILLLYEIERLN